MSPIKFAGPDELPDGFLYRDGFLSEPEEAELLRIFQGLEFAAYDYHGYLAKRRVARYGVNYDLNTREPNENALPIPDFLLGIRARGAEVAEVTAEKLVQAMVSEYSAGTPIGWHRDAPQFGIIIGISLGQHVPHAAEALSGDWKSFVTLARTTLDLCNQRRRASWMAAQHTGGRTIALFDYVSYAALQAEAGFSPKSVNP